MRALRFFQISPDGFQIGKPEGSGLGADDLQHLFSDVKGIDLAGLSEAAGQPDGLKTRSGAEIRRDHAGPDIQRVNYSFGFYKHVPI